MTVSAEAFAKPLSGAAMTEAMTAVMTGAMPPEQVGVFLSTLAKRGETAEEIAAAVSVLRAHAVKLPLKKTEGLADTCGTGGDGLGTINVSTGAALVAAACGVRVVKHGNRAASSKCGSADVLEALGVRLDASPEAVAACVDAVGFGFCFAPKFHPAMKAVAPIRKALGIRTIFNLIGPLANPAPLSFQLVGVPEERWLSPMAEALQRLGLTRALVVRGRDGLDEVSTTAPTDAIELAGGQLTRRVFEPAKLGLIPATLAQLRGGDAAQNAAALRAVFAGAPGPVAEIVAVNAACVLMIAGKAGTVEEGLIAARNALTTGAAAALLEQVITRMRDAG